MRTKKTTNEEVEKVPQNFNGQVGGLLKTIIVQSGKNIKDIAESLGVCRVTLSMILSARSKNTMSVKTILGLCSVLKRNLVIGFLTDEEAIEFKKLLSERNTESKYCPNCGQSFEITNVTDGKNLLDKFAIGNFLEDVSTK